MSQKIRPFLMFEGAAEEAMRFYVSLFPDSKITEMVRYGPNESGAKGSVKRADFALAGLDLICVDSSIKHAFSFTPSMSLFVECQSEDELDRLFGSLSEGGKVLMPPDNYGFGKKFCWVDDRFGVSWQLNCQ